MQGDHRYLHVCGRYRLDERALVHRSETCEVLFAVDLEDTSEAYRDGRPVAPKMMKHRHQWESEIRARQNHTLSSSSVVNLLAWHVAEGEVTIPNEDKASERTCTEWFCVQVHSRDGSW